MKPLHINFKSSLDWKCIEIISRINGQSNIKFFNLTKYVEMYIYTERKG